MSKCDLRAPALSQAPPPPPNDIRKNIAKMLDNWKNMYYNMKGLSQKVDQYLKQGPDLEIVRGIVEFRIFGYVRHGRD